MLKKPTIPTEIQEEVLKIVEEFNQKKFHGRTKSYFESPVRQDQTGICGEI